MSHFPSAPPPGVYVPPNQSPQPQGFSQPAQPHYGYQQPLAHSSHAASPAYVPGTSGKPTKALGQVFNQAVTQGKPMLDKLGKSISSKLGNKQSKPIYNPGSTPQNNYQNYQQQHQYGQSQTQQYQSPQSPSYLNQGQQSVSGPQSVYQTPQQSPYQQSSYATPVSSNSDQKTNYFPPQVPTAPQQQAPQYQQGPPQTFYQQSHSPGVDVNPVQQGQGHFPPGQHQGNPQQTPYGQDSGQQTGIIGGTQSQYHPNFQQQTSPINEARPEKQQQQQQQQQQQWTSPTPGQNQYASPVAQSHVPALGEQQQQHSVPHQHVPPPPPPPQSPAHMHPTPPPQQYNAAPPIPAHPSQSQPPQQPHPSQYQQWAAPPPVPVSPPAQQAQPSSSGASPLPQPAEPEKPAPAATFALQQQQQVHTEPTKQQQPDPSPISPAHEEAPNDDPTGFIAELPADFGSMNLVEGSKADQVPPSASQAAAYRAYRPASGQNTGGGPGYSIARRAVSTSSLPLADPWRLADPSTELPTREFYILADLVFDSLDRRFEPQNTGLLEASKVLESWKAQQLPGEAAALFAHDSYSAFGKMWSLQNVPHVLVPCQPSLMPTWNFQQQVHAQELKLQETSASQGASYPVYMPALNRAGWYKYAFLNWLHQPEDLKKMLTTFCAETYNPGILNQPDMHKRDVNEPAGLVSRATAISTGAVGRVCQEVVAQMQGSSRDGKQGGGQQ